MNFKRSFLLVCTLLLVCSVAKADPKPVANWQTYTSTEGRFKVDMPEKPNNMTKELEAAPGQKMYGFGLNYNGGGMLATASDVAEDRAKVPDQTLDTVRDVAAKSLNATISNEKKEMVGKYPARRFDYSSAAKNFSGTLRLVLANGRMYQLNAIGPAGFSDSADAKRFLDSFAVVE